MSKQTQASEHWEHQAKLVRIELLLKVANDPMNPVGQAQVAIQLARVEVPWMLAEIEKLRGQLNEQHQAAA